MILTHLGLTHFRSYSSLSLDLAPGLNLILGPNGAGKSNLAEAVYYLSLARSWRSTEDGVLIQSGERSALINAEVSEGSLHRHIAMEIFPQNKRIAVNGKGVRRLSELSRLTNVIVFSPSDVPLFQGSPGERRSFLDISLSKRSLDYFQTLQAYNRLLKERNAALKEENPDVALVKVLGEQMAEKSVTLLRLRALYIGQINQSLPKVISELRDEPTEASLVYHPFVKVNEEAPKAAKAAFARSLDSDLRHHATSVGPHREDFSFLFQGKDLASYGSQGENRVAVLALKLTPYFLIDDPDKKPICVLDDAMSELDEVRQKRLLSFVRSNLSQTLITTTNTIQSGAAIIDVAPGGIAIRRS